MDDPILLTDMLVAEELLILPPEASHPGISCKITMSLLNILILSLCFISLDDYNPL